MFAPAAPSKHRVEILCSGEHRTVLLASRTPRTNESVGQLCDLFEANACGADLECGSLLLLSVTALACARTDSTPRARPASRLGQSGSKLPHSKGQNAYGINRPRAGCEKINFSRCYPQGDSLKSRSAKVCQTNFLTPSVARAARRGMAILAMTLHGEVIPC
jgi:hypothetical protein